MTQKYLGRDIRL